MVISNWVERKLEERRVKREKALVGCFQSIRHVLTFVNDTQTISKRPDR